MRVSTLLFVIGSLMNGPITMAVPGAMVSVITVTPSNKSPHGSKGKGNIHPGISSTEHPLKSSNSGSGSSSISSSPSSTSGSNSGLHKQHYPNLPGSHTASNPSSHLSNHPVSSSSINLPGSAPSNMLLPLLHPRGREKKIHTPRHSKPISSSDHSSTGTNVQNHPHYKSSGDGQNSNLLSRVKRRGARGGGFGNAGRKGPRDRLDYRKGGATSSLILSPFSWTALVTTGPSVLLSLLLSLVLFVL